MDRICEMIESLGVKSVLIQRAMIGIMEIGGCSHLHQNLLLLSAMSFE